MAVAAAEQTKLDQSIAHLDFTPDSYANSQNFDGEPPVQPRAVAIPETQKDQYTCERAAEFIGACLTGHEVELENDRHLDVEPIESLFDAIKKAAEGDFEARNMVMTNVTTEGIEITQKVKHVNEVTLSVDEAQRIQQHGHSQESIQANSLRYATGNPKMLPRVEAEVRNSFRIGDTFEEGLLEDHVVVVLSPAADNMTEREMSDTGFFTDTMTCMIQVTGANGNALTTEVAMVAGVKEPGGERHDIRGIVALGRRLGVNLEGKNAAEIIDSPILIHKSKIPNGVIDVVEMLDEEIDGENERKTLFGQDLAKGEALDYQAVLGRSREIQRNFQPRTEAATDELVARAHTINDRVHATKTLHKVVEKHMVLQAVEDVTINPKVFGPAAGNIVEARIQVEHGNYEEAALQTEQAIIRAVSSSCPAALKNALGGSDGGESADEDEFGPLTFKCTRGHTNTRARGRLLTKCRVEDCSGTVGC